MHSWVESFIERAGFGGLLAVRTERQLDMKHRTQETKFDGRAW